MFLKLSNFICLGDNFVYLRVLNFSLFLSSLQIQKTSTTTKVRVFHRMAKSLPALLDENVFCFSIVL